MEKLELAISGMSCGHCIGAVKQALEELDGVSVSRVEIGTAELSYDPVVRKAEDILDAVADAGYQAERVAGAGGMS